MIAFTIARIVAAAMLLWATQHNPSAYYDVLRFVVFGVSLFSAFVAYKLARKGWLLTFIVIALLFNALIPVYLYNKEIWTLINVVAAGLFIYSIFTFKGPEGERREG